jgi:hypothetical protein
MKIIAFITEAVAIREILGHLGEPTAPPTLMPARGPPLWELAGSEPDEIDPQAQPAPDYEFDQRVAWQGKTSRRTSRGSSRLRTRKSEISDARVTAKRTRIMREQVFQVLRHEFPD